MTNPPPYPGNQPYGQMPGYQQQGSRMPRPTPPGSVTGAFLLYLLNALVSLASIIVLFGEGARADLRRELAAQQSNLSEADLDSLVRVGFIVVIGIAVVFIALFLFFAFMMRAGRNWARIVLTVLSGLSIAGSLGGNAYSTGQDWATWAGLAFSVVAIVLMFLTPSNEYFQRSKQFRAQQQLLG